VRFQGIFFTGIPLGILLALYASLVWPVKSSTKPTA